MKPVHYLQGGSDFFGCRVSECGRPDVAKSTTTWSQVTCKVCLKLQPACPQCGGSGRIDEYDIVGYFGEDQCGMCDGEGKVRKSQLIGYPARSFDD